MKNTDRFEHCENALLYSFFFSLFVFVYFALYFDLYFDLFFFFMLRVSNEIQEFQVEILFEHFFFDGNVDLRLRLRRRSQRRRCCC